MSEREASGRFYRVDWLPEGYELVEDYVPPYPGKEHEQIDLSVHHIATDTYLRKLGDVELIWDVHYGPDSDFLTEEQAREALARAPEPRPISFSFTIPLATKSVEKPKLDLIERACVGAIAFEQGIHHSDECRKANPRGSHRRYLCRCDFFERVMEHMPTAEQRETALAEARALIAGGFYQVSGRYRELEHADGRQVKATPAVFGAFKVLSGPIYSEASEKGIARPFDKEVREVALAEVLREIGS